MKISRRNVPLRYSLGKWLVFVFVDINEFFIDPKNIWYLIVLKVVKISNLFRKLLNFRTSTYFMAEIRYLIK